MIKFSPIGPVTVDADMSIREFIKMLEENRRIERINKKAGRK